MGTSQVGPGAAATHSAAPVHPGPSGQCRSCLSACRAWGFGCHHRAPPRRSCLCGSRGPGDPGPSHASCCPPVTTCGGQERGLGAPQSQLSQAEARVAGSGPAAALAQCCSGPRVARLQLPESWTPPRVL